MLMSVLCVQFAEKFAEYKEAARLAKEKSQEKMEMATSPSQVRQHSSYSPPCITVYQSVIFFPLVMLTLTDYHRRHRGTFIK